MTHSYHLCYLLQNTLNTSVTISIISLQDTFNSKHPPVISWTMHITHSLTNYCLCYQLDTIHYLSYKLESKHNTLPVIHHFFMCHVSTHGCCHLWPWLSDFSSGVLFHAFSLNHFHRWITQPNPKTRFHSAVFMAV